MKKKKRSSNNNKSKQDGSDSSSIKKQIIGFWNFVWKDESVLGWIVSLAIIFLIIKFVFFPLLSLVLGTSLPLVVVESSSMSHNALFFGGFSDWWDENHAWYEENSITKDQAQSWTLSSGLEKGDIALVMGIKDPKVGDIIIFNAGQKHPIIHRVVNVVNSDGETRYYTKGDGNEDQITFDKNIIEDQIVGRAVFKIPKLGWIKLFFVEAFQSI